MIDATASPPIAPRKPHSSTHHGITIADDYAWLRDPGYPKVEDAEVLDYLKAENAWFEARMAPHEELVDELFAEMKGRIKEDDSSVPQRYGDYLYWTKFEEGAQYPQHYRKSVAGGADELLLDEVALAEGHEYFNLGQYAVTRDGRMLAFATDTDGSERFVLRVKDLTTGRNPARRNPRHARQYRLGRGRQGAHLRPRQRELAHRFDPPPPPRHARSPTTSSSTTRTTTASAPMPAFRRRRTG